LASLRRHTLLDGRCSILKKASYILQRSYSGITAPSPRDLDSIMKLDELVPKSREEIMDIWKAYHEDPKSNRAAEIMNANEYDKFNERTFESKMFVLPLAKGNDTGSFMTLLLQAQMPYILITGLDDFRQFGPNAMPYVTLTVYPELRESKDLVLIRADNLNEKSITFQETQSIASTVKSLYVDDAKYAKFIQCFNHRPNEFNFDDLLKELGISPK